MFFSYDHCGSTYDIEKAGDLLSDYDRNKKRCYVLIGYDGETIDSAERRLLKIWEVGFMPFCQYYRDDDFKKKKLDTDWQDLIRIFSRPAIMRGYCKKKLAACSVGIRVKIWKFTGFMAAMLSAWTLKRKQIYIIGFTDIFYDCSFLLHGSYDWKEGIRISSYAIDFFCKKLIHS